jgi:TonB family protein
MSMIRRPRRRRAPTAIGIAALVLLWAASATPAAQDQSQRLRDWAAAGEIESIRTLLAAENPIAVDSTDALGWTPLMHAADAGHDTVVELLLDAGASPQSQNSAQETALHLAARQGWAGVAQLLLGAGADFEARDAEGRTPLFMAIDGRHAEVIGLLHGAARSTARRRSPALALAVESETAPPVIIQWIDPPYTDDALARAVEGTITLIALIGHDGTVGVVNVSEGLEESLDQSALRAVSNWRFDPATRDGRPVDVVVEINVNFAVPEQP